MNYGAIKYPDIANGPGVRVSLFVSGCRNHCKGCFQPETWDFSYGQEYTRETQEELLLLLSPEYVDGLSILGGEPFEPENQSVLRELVHKVNHLYPEKSIWCYTGYRYDRDLIPGGKVYTADTDAMLKCIDVLVDGEFILDQKDITLKFRGSRNQRIIALGEK